MTRDSCVAARTGNFVRYEIADPAVFELCERVCGGLHRQLSELEELLHPTDPRRRVT